MTLPRIAALAALAVPALAQDAPPKAPARVVNDTYHGETVGDPYRWLEDYQSDEAKGWVRAQDAWTRKHFAALPAREHYRKRLAELEAIPADAVSSYGASAPMLMKDGSLFYLKRKAREPQAKLYVRASAAAPERMLYDPMADRAADANPRAIAWMSPSPDAKHVAIGVAEGGSERAELFVVQTASGKVVDGPIARADAAQPSWMPDGRAFFYMRLAAGKSEADRYTDSQARFHRLGQEGDDAIVFGNAHPSTKSIDKLHFPNVFVDPAGELLYGFVSRGTERPYMLYLATMKDFRAGKLEWKPLFGFDAGFEVPEPDDYPPLALRDGKLILFTRKGNPDGSVVALDPRKPGEAPKTLFAAKDRPITYYAQTRDGFYVRLQDGPVGRVIRIDPRTGAATPIALPIEGSASFAQSNPEADGLVVLGGGWTAPSEWLIVGKGATRAQPLPLADMSALRAIANLDAEVVLVPSHDGVQVPMSIVYAKGFKKDGTAPAFLSGYGGYGLVDQPFFSRNFVALAERGFVLAVCHVRGSGAYGERWHKAGFKATKPNTWKDFIACAEWLAKNGYASPRRLAGTGGSAGGILIGRAVTERPDLFGAAVIRVGVLDMLRFETTANGKTNIPEFGTVAIAEEYRGLKAMSTYHTIADGTKYPALLLTHGFNDPRVPVWTTTKGAARFQAASGSGKPVLLRVEMDAGHGIGSSTAQREIENADIFAFLEEYLK